MGTTGVATAGGGMPARGVIVTQADFVVGGQDGVKPGVQRSTVRPVVPSPFFSSTNIGERRTPKLRTYRIAVGPADTRIRLYADWPPAACQVRCRSNITIAQVGGDFATRDRVCQAIGDVAKRGEHSGDKNSTACRPGATGVKAIGYPARSIPLP